MTTGSGTPDPGAIGPGQDAADAKAAASRKAAATTPTTTTPPTATAPTAIDSAFDRTRVGNPRAFATWVRLAESQLRRSLRPFAPHVDVEAVLQEGLLRMWKLAPALRLTGPDASLRYALRIVKNLAISEARRNARLSPLELETLDRLPEGSIDPDPLPDPHLHQLILKCIALLPKRPREALRARLDDSSRASDRELAADLRMKLNTFLQNIVRARRLVAECLARHGVTLDGVKT